MDLTIFNCKYNKSFNFTVVIRICNLTIALVKYICSSIGSDISNRYRKIQVARFAVWSYRSGMVLKAETKRRRYKKIHHTVNY